MKGIRKTDKLMQAIRILSSEGYSDTSEQAWVEAIETGKVMTRSVYSAMNMCGYRWDTISWYNSGKRSEFVRSIFAAVRKIDNRMMKEQGLL